jgi:hypothetical protein
LSPADASKLVDDAAMRIWSPEGAEALGYLHARGLDDQIIRAARLGFVADASIPMDGGARYWRVGGVIIPWSEAGRLTLVKIRRLGSFRGSKYVEAFRDAAGIFPDPAVIEPGKPLVICEGEFDALLLGQALGDMAAVVTLGSASSRPEAATRFAMLDAPVWYLAHDADPAGDKAASGWPARAVRVRPPCFIMPEAGRNTKDWSDVAANGVDLSRWWRDRLGGIEAHKLFTWDELATWRWSGDAEPGITIDKPDRGRMLAALKARIDDPEEREAIQEYG